MRIWLWLMALVGIGTTLGKDPVFNRRDKVEIDGLFVSEIGAADRQALIDIWINSFKIPDIIHRGNRQADIRLFLVAAALRNSRGYYLFDPTLPNHMAELATWPSGTLVRLINAAAELACLEDIKVINAKEDPGQEPPTNEDDAPVEDQGRHPNP